MEETDVEMETTSETKGAKQEEERSTEEDPSFFTKEMEDLDKLLDRNQENGDIEKVKKVQDKVVELQRQARVIKSCFKGWCFARYHLGKESKKKIVIVDELLIEQRLFDSVATRVPIPPRVVENFDAFESREPNKKEVIQALMDD
ncbi:hypothetical protein GIB67_017049 [Kingdonia uniflora]|uniref:Uncharacterized protein n=1 Tax=Kingdonia uniflora TaxID=39325 RepID=A0A7J7NCF2_9MAGN|nr:hypothetical protein GIB67_017049 [Kingdonia uniflora]